LIPSVSVFLLISARVLHAPATGVCSSLSLHDALPISGCRPKSIRSVPSPGRGCRTSSPPAPARSGPGSCPVRSSSPGPRTVGGGCGTRVSHEHRFADVARVDHSHHLPPVVLEQVRLDSDVAAFGAFGHGDHGRLHVSKWMNSHT